MRNRWPIIIGVVLALGLIFACGVCVIAGVGGGLAGLGRFVEALPTPVPKPTLVEGERYWLRGIPEPIPDYWINLLSLPEHVWGGKSTIVAVVSDSSEVRLVERREDWCYVEMTHEYPREYVTTQKKEGWVECHRLLDYQPTPLPTPVRTPQRPAQTLTPQAPTPTFTSLPKPETYGEFNLSFFQRAGMFEVTKPIDIFGTRSSWKVGPEEGIDIALVIVRLNNTGDRWIYPLVMPGWLTDTQGERYRERTDFIVDEQGDPSSPDVSVFQSEQGPIVLSDASLADEKIGPGESLQMGFFIDLPQDREAASFIFQYEAWETAMPLVGEEWRMEAIIPIGE